MQLGPNGLMMITTAQLPLTSVGMLALWLFNGAKHPDAIVSQRKYLQCWREDLQPSLAPASALAAQGFQAMLSNDFVLDSWNL